MKKRIVSTLMLISLILPIFSVNSVVCAYSGEIDPENYITLPSIINVNENKEGTGTISLSTSASDYSIYYQKVDITKEQMDNIQTKENQYNQYIETYNKEITAKNAELNELKSKYEELNNSSTATEEEKTIAKNNYEEAVKEYNQYGETANQKI